MGLKAFDLCKSGSLGTVFAQGVEEKERTLDLFMKSYTPRGEENLAVPAVGEDMAGARKIIPHRLRREMS